MYKISLSVILTLFCFDFASAQSNAHVSWAFRSVKLGDREWRIELAATPDRGWYLYSQFLPEGGPVPTTIEFERAAGVTLSGKTKETGSIRRGYDATFMMDLAWYDGKVVFEQKLKVRSKAVVRGEVRYSLCSKEMCVPGRARFEMTVGE